MRKIIINEGAARKIIEEEYLNKNDVERMLKTDKGLEKRIKNIVADSLNDLFKILWQRKNFYDSDLRN